MARRQRSQSGHAGCERRDRGRLRARRAARAQKVANAASISPLVLALRTWICSPMAPAAASMSLNVDSAAGMVGLRAPPRAAPGTSSRSSSSRFAASSPRQKLMPVRLPPGRARLATRPSLTGSSPTLKTIGIVVVAALAANAAAHRRPRRSPRPAGEPDRPPAPAVDHVTLRPAIFDRHVLALDIAGLLQTRGMRAGGPRSFGRWLLRKPITGIAGCCARAASGHRPPRCRGAR